MFSYSKFEHGYDKSYFKYTEPLSEDFEVTVNGESVPVYTCRISKYPINRVWPGEQRPSTQTELASFVNLVSDEPISLTVKVKRKYSRILIKPYSKKISFTKNGEDVSFELKENGAFVFETDSYHHCLYIFNSKPIPAPEPSRVTHFFGPGIHMAGKITLNDGESVYVDKDALVFGCIFADGAKDIRIFGNGIFDDSAEGRFHNCFYEEFTNGNIKFYNCENASVEGVSFRNSAIWCVNAFNCKNVTFDGIRVFGQWKYNTDGVDIVNSRYVTVKNSFIHSFDDTVTIKGIDRFASTDNEHILVENCTLWCDWGKTCEIGIETACRKYNDIVFNNCDILRAGNTALDIQNGDTAEVSNVTFKNIRVEYNAFDTPELYQSSDEMEYNRMNETAYPYLISIKNNRWRTEENAVIWNLPMQYLTDVDFSGVENGGVHDVTVRDITVYYDDSLPLEDGKFNIKTVAYSCLEGVKFYNLNVEDVKVIYKGEVFPIDVVL